MSKVCLINRNECAAEASYYDDGEDWESLCKRVSSAIATGEENYKSISNAFYEILYNKKFIPGGRILRNAGKLKRNLLNCFVIPVEDSIESIGNCFCDSLITWAYGGGVGVNFSSLRPKGAKIESKGGESSGLVSFLDALNGVADTIEVGGQRRAACIAIVDVSHPEIEEFIDAKLTYGKLNHFNISVAINNLFLEAVERDSDWNLEFRQKVYRTVKAKSLWNKILKNMIESAEPGLINMDNLIKSNSYYFAPIVGTNPCQPYHAPVLTRNGVAKIGSLKIGDEIWSENGWVKVTQKFNLGKKDVYKICTSFGVFFGTLNHKIKSENKKIEVGNAKFADILYGFRGNQEITWNKRAIMDGLLIGDGSVHKTSNNLIYLCIGKNDSDYFKSEISDLIIKHRPGIRYYAYEVSGTLTYEELPKTYKRQVPDRYKYADINVICSFLRGIFSANGSVLKKYKQIVLKSTSKVLIEDIQMMLSAVGIKSYFTTNKKRSVKFKNGLYNCRESYDINITSDCSIFQQKIGFIQRYKNNLLDEIIKKNPIKNNKNTYKILSKEYFSREDVFDITVDGPSHTYWSGGYNVSNCGELPLGAYGSCDLGSINLPKFVTDGGSTQWASLKETIQIAVRFLDNVIDITTFPISKMQHVAEEGRRIGLGVMGLADYFFKKQIRYGSEKAILELENLFKFIRNTAYIESISLANEKGPFQKFDPVDYGKASFIRKLPAKIRKSIKDYGIRNSSLMTCAPTGTTSLVAGVTSGVEPLFSKAYVRKDKFGETIFIHPIYEEIIKNKTKIPDWFVDAHDLSPEEHFETQAVIQRYVDGAISKTINLPEKTTVTQLSEWLLEYAYELKGVTVYVDKSMKEQVLYPMTKKKVLEYIGGLKNDS